MSDSTRRKALITGAVGGMGRACARLFGATHDLVLTDRVQAPLDEFAEELRGESFSVVAHAGGIGDDAVLAGLAGELQGDQPFALIHTAGLSPALGDWRSIMEVNLVATEKLLRAVEPCLSPGSVAVLIASSAGHSMPAIPEIDAVLADPLSEAFLPTVEAIIGQMGGDNVPGGRGGISYSMSKRAVLLLCRERALSWGGKGARIVSVSPGMIDTPMGQAELEQTPGARQVLEATPVGRIGTPLDIALAAQFLASDAAGFITGTDLLVDGGATPVLAKVMAAGAA
jgi:NAD(P)-dependent dehydrogenase (short-subunit alcohol dehydrogenase family)